MPYITSFSAILSHAQPNVFEVAVVPLQGGRGSAQGRSPIYRAIKPKTVAVIIKLKVQLEYEVTKLTIIVRIPYQNQRLKPVIKYASAIIGLRQKILPLRTRPTPEPIRRTITTQLGYQVQRIQLKSACAYEVDKLITAEQQNKLRILAVSFLASSSDL